MNTTSTAFHDFEHAGWEAVPCQYNDAFARLTSQSIGPLLDAAGVTQGRRLLDVATGPGYVAAAAARLGAEVVGIDFSAGMLAEARRQNPTLDLREGDAEQLPFSEESFDAVVMNFGLLHMAQPERAVAQAFRVLRRQGRFAFTVWAPPDKALGLGIVLDSIQRHGDMSVPLPPGPPFFRFSDPAECEKVLGAAGFDEIQVTQVPQVWRMASAQALFDTMLKGTVRIAALLRAQRPEALAHIQAAVRDAAERFRVGEGIELAMPSVLASAMKR
jgi:ubiquinone/menaquinone biosynthesis C-methylase UbiE